MIKPFQKIPSAASDSVQMREPRNAVVSGAGCLSGYEVVATPTIPSPNILGLPLRQLGAYDDIITHTLVDCVS